MIYSDVVKNGWILPYKEIYTIQDFNKLHKVHDALIARFIIICTVIKYIDKGKVCRCSNVFDDIKKFELMDYLL